MGVPQQDSILSVTLFSLKINSIVRSLPPDVRCSLYVDDFLICCRSRYMPAIERKLQICLRGIERWADENGFKFSRTKTVCMHFCQKRSLHPDPELTLYGDKIPVVDETKFLGLVFDRKLTFQSHIKYLRDQGPQLVESGSRHGLGSGLSNSAQALPFAHSGEAPTMDR
jgi:hypothetical protein